MKNKQSWKDYVRNIYSSLDELAGYDSIYGICKRCGFNSAKEMWNKNPKIGGGVNPADFGLVK